MKRWNEVNGLDYPTDIPEACLWPGHAAIRNLVRVVLEEAAKRVGNLGERADIRALLEDEQ